MMKSRKMVLAAVLGLVLVTAACGKKDDADSGKEAAGTQVTATGTQAESDAEDSAGSDSVGGNRAAADEGEDGKTGAATADESKGGKTGAAAVDDSASMERYQSFLAGTEQLNISKVDFSMYMLPDLEPVLQPDRAYTMEEFLETFFGQLSNYNAGDYYVDELSYAYVDCGQDGNRELALRFVSHQYNDEYNNIMVIKDIDEKLELCCWFSDGYRAYNYINNSGVIARGGSGGADDWIDDYYSIDENGNRYLVYGSEQCSSYNLSFGGKDFGTVAEDLGVGDICVTRYSFEEYDFEAYDENSYEQFMGNSTYTFGRYKENGSVDESDALYAADSDYAAFMDLMTDNWYTPAEAQRIVDDHLSELGLTEQQLAQDEPEWQKWEGHEELFAATHYAAPVITVENPSWEYYSTAYPYEEREDFVTLEEISHEANQITDDAEWFAEIGAAQPAAGTIEDPNGEYTYYLTSTYGDYDHQYDTVRIHDNWRDMDIATLDFADFVMPDDYVPSDVSYVRECVEYVQIVDNVVYVSIAHRTYAESAPHTAYVMALDMADDYRVLWKSEPLVCNSDNFAIVDGSLICGYGFTAEPDYVYELNRYTGEKMDTIQVKTGPSYFYAVDGKLYVRTYDTNYIFQISWG